MSTPTVVIQSMWRNDATKHLPLRVERLLAKNYPNVRYIWIVGDCDDPTYGLLEQHVARYPHKDIKIIRYDTGLDADTPNERLERMSLTADRGFEEVKVSDDIWVIHESDLYTPVDIISRFVEHYREGRQVIGGMPVMHYPTGETLFYDTWAYVKNGVNFSNFPPYHYDYKPGQLMELEGVGSAWAFPAYTLMQGLRCKGKGTRSLCRDLRETFELSIWMDDSIQVVQPWALSEAWGHADFE